MRSPIPVTAIFDIGKTNKKFFLFDEDFSIVKKEQVKLEQIQDEDGDSCENLDGLQEWIDQNISEVKKDPAVKVRALNFSTYGASLVHLDKKGEPATPLYNYLKPYPEDLLNRFYNNYKGKRALSVETASPPMGMLNSGLQLYWLKHEKPEDFRKVKESLHFPQYLSFLMTGKKVSELTSIGCHTALWNFEQNDYHAWLKQEDFLKLLPPIEPVHRTFPVQWNDHMVDAGVGIHDSSAALAPYLYMFDEPFMLISTGTWSITFNPFNKSPITFEELQRDCLCYINVFGKQVKASRFFLGDEYARQLKKLKEFFKVSEDDEDVELDTEMIKKLIDQEDPSRKLKLETAYNSGPFPQNKPGQWKIDKFDSFKEAYHQLMLDLVTIQAESINLAAGSVDTKKLIITGGFSQNNFFVRLLSCFFPGKEIYTSSLPNASALGAALVLEDRASGDEKKPVKELLSLQKHIPCRVPEIGKYEWKKSVFTRQEI